jgi:putative endonuclease
VLGTNVHVGHDELDVVALDGSTLVVVEVRYRRTAAHGHPFESITRAKAARLRRAASRYMLEHGATELRIDVAAVIGGVVDIVENAIDFTST